MKINKIFFKGKLFTNGQQYLKAGWYFIIQYKFQFL